MCPAERGAQTRRLTATLRISSLGSVGTLWILFSIVVADVPVSESASGSDLFGECLSAVGCPLQHRRTGTLPPVQSSSLLQSLHNEAPAGTLPPLVKASSEEPPLLVARPVEQLAPHREAEENAASAASKKAEQEATAAAAMKAKEEAAADELASTRSHFIEMISLLQRRIGQFEALQMVAANTQRRLSQFEASDTISTTAIVLIVLVVVILPVVGIFAMACIHVSSETPRYAGGRGGFSHQSDKLEVPGSPAASSSGPSSLLGRHRNQPQGAGAYNRNPASLSPAPRDAGPQEHARMSPQARSPSKAGELSSRPTGQGSVFQATLCPDLVVPQGSECTVVVPKVPLGSSHDVTFTVDDSMGSPAFRVAWFPEARGLDLMSVGSEVVFAHCRAENHGVAIYQGPADMAAGRFAELWPDPAFADGMGYAASTHGGYKVLFRADGHRSNMNATDKDGRLLSIFETIQAEKRNVRVGPLVDVGFVVLTLLGIDLLQGQKTSAARSKQ